MHPMTPENALLPTNYSGQTPGVAKAQCSLYNCLWWYRYRVWCSNPMLETHCCPGAKTGFQEIKLGLQLAMSPLPHWGL